MKQCFLEYMQDHLWRNLTLVFGLCLMGLIMVLYQIPKQTILYCLEFALAIIFCSMLVEYYRYYKSFCARRNLLQSIQYHTTEELPPSINYMEEEYREIIRQLFKEKKEELDRKEASYQELKDYIMMWAHQIKTPITGLKLLLDQEEKRVEHEEDVKKLRQMKEELFSIEDYVGMNLEYIRLDSLNADLSVEECHLETLVKKEVMHFSQMFIARQLSIQMENLDHIVISDSKWLAFVLDQILSNALKYTKKGGICIFAKEQDKKVYLMIQDTGIGIAKEDLPRIFEKAFTGFNGHVDHKATGIGLYLSKQILDRLGHRIKITSQVGKGTCVTLCFLTKM